jgi:hypothetical protein
MLVFRGVSVQGAAVVQAEFAQQGRNVAFHCPHGNKELAGDLGVRHPRGHQVEHLCLADGQLHCTIVAPLFALR